MILERIGQLLGRQKTMVHGVLVLMISFLLFLSTGADAAFRPQNWVLSFMSLIQGAVTQSADFVTGTFNSIQELRDLRQEYDALQEQLNYFEGLERQLVELRVENRRMRELLEFGEELDWEQVPARIVAKDPTGLFRSYTVNKGFAQGVREGMPVIAYQDGNYGLVGRIANVGLSSALVQPILDSNSYVATRFQNIREEGLTRGQGNRDTTLLMDYVPRQALEEINYGDLVVTSGLRSHYPAGIAVGRVQEIQFQDYESVLEIILEPVISFSRLEYVYIISEGRNPVP